MPRHGAFCQQSESGQDSRALKRISKTRDTTSYCHIVSYCIWHIMALYMSGIVWYCTSLYGTVLTLCHTLPIIADHEVVWNGPAGVFEFDNFSKGTKALAETGCNPFESQIVSSSSYRSDHARRCWKRLQIFMPQARFETFASRIW